MQWQQIADVVNAENKTTWTPGACRRRFTKLYKDYKEEPQKQRKVSGERTEADELANLMYEIVQQIEESK